MNKIFKYFLLTIVIGYVLVNLIIYSFTYLYSHGAGGAGKIKEYEFKTTANDFKKELKLICDKSEYISFKDTIENEGYDKTLITIQIEKKLEKIIYFAELQELSEKDNRHVTLYLVYINGQKNDDFSWFSLEKYKKLKLFEREVIEPLSSKYEKID